MKKILITEQQFNSLVNNLLNEDEDQKQNIVTKLKKQFPKIDWDKTTSPGTTYEEILIKADPTNVLTYLPWIVKQYNDILKHKITDIKPDQFIEDLYKVKDYLEIYNKIKHNLSPEQANINNYKTYKDLYNIVEPYVENKDVDLELSKTQQQLEIKKEAEKIYEDNKWLIVWPKTEKASCLYGKGSQWCTAADRSKNMFNSYNSHGSFNYVINKQNQKEKYAFFFDKHKDIVNIYDIHDNRIQNINDFFKKKKELLNPLIASGKKYYSWKFLLMIGEKNWVNYVDPNIEELDLSNLNLKSLSGQISQLTNLIKLNLLFNNLNKIPESIGNLKNLRHLSVQKNNLRTLPDSIGDLSQLNELVLSYNDLIELPSSIGRLSNLKRLYLGGNKDLKNLSQQITKLPNLKKLNYLTIKNIPLSEKNIQQIRKLLPNTILGL